MIRVIKNFFQGLRNIILGNKDRQNINNVLIYSHYENDLLFLTDGTIVKAYEFEGSVKEENDTNYYQALNSQIQNSLSLLPINTTLHKVDLKISKIYDKKVHVNNNTLALDIAEHFKGRTGLDHKCYVFIIFGADPIDNPLLTKLSRLNINVTGTNKLNTGDIRAYQNSCNAFSAAINSSGLKLNPVNGINKLYTVIHNCLNLKLDYQERKNVYIEGDIVKHKDYIEIGKKLCSYVTMMGQPEKLFPTMQNENGIPVSYTAPIYDLPFPHSVHTTFQKLDREKKLNKMDNEKFFQMSTFNENENDIRTEGSQIRFSQMQKDTVKIREQNLSLYNVSIAAGIFATDERTLNERINEATNAFHHVGLEPLQESYDNLNIHWSYMPGNAANAYRTFCTTGQCAAVYFNTDTNRHFKNEGISFIDRDMFPVKFKLISDLTDNPHLLLIGSSGSGKTFTMNHIVHTRHKQGAIQILIDQKGDYENLVNSLDGKHINYSAENPIRFNPFLIGNEITNDRLEFLTEFIMSIPCFDPKDAVIYSVILTRIQNYLEYEAKNEDETASLKRFYEWNNSQDFKVENFPENNFKVALELYATGPYSNLFNHTDIEDFTDVKLLSIDFKPIVDARYYKQVFMIVNEICKQIILKYPYEQKCIYMDECWSQLAHNPEFINYYIRVGRSLNVAIHIITQTIAEIVNTDIKDVLISNIDTKLLTSHTGKHDQIETISETFGLTDHHKNLFASLTEGMQPRYKEIFVLQKDKAVVLGVEVPLNLVGLYTTVAEEKSAFNQLKKLNGGNVRNAQLDFTNLIKAKANFVKIDKISNKGIDVLKQFKEGRPIISDINKGNFDYLLTESETLTTNKKEALI